MALQWRDEYSKKFWVLMQGDKVISKIYHDKGKALEDAENMAAAYGNIIWVMESMEVVRSEEVQTTWVASK